MVRTDLKKRTKDFSLRVIRLCRSLDSKDWVALTIGKQILRCGTSVGANYRATVLAKSTRDFINKLKIVEEELDETLFWLEMLADADVVKLNKLTDLTREATELLKITSASILTMKKKHEKDFTSHSVISNS